MEEFTKKLLKNQLISLSLGLFFFFFVNIITRYTIGGLGTKYGVPFTHYYNYYFSPGVEFECPILWNVNLVLFCIFFMALGLIRLLIKEKQKDFRLLCVKFLSIMISLLVFFSVLGFLICPFPDFSDLPGPSEFVYASDAVFKANYTEKTLKLAGLRGGHMNLKWNDTTITVDGSKLEWDDTIKTWRYENVEIIYSDWNSIDVIGPGDYISNCTGNITIKYNPSDVTFGTWGFS